MRGRYTSSDWLSFRDSFVSALLECWSLSWMFVVLDSDFLRKETEERPRFLRTVKHSLEVVLRLASGTPSTLDWPKLAQFALRAWLKIEFPTATELCLLHDICLLVPPMARNLTYEKLVEVAEKVGMDVVAVVKLAIARLRRFGRALQALADSSNAPIDIVGGLCDSLSSINFVFIALLRPRSGQSPAISAPELKDPFIRVISLSCRLVKIVLPVLSCRYTSVFRTAERYVILVAILLDILPDIRAINMALGKGLITSIVAASRHSSELKRDGIRALNDPSWQNSARNLIFRSVVVWVQKSLQSCRSGGERTCWFWMRSDLRAKWTFFFELLDHYAAALTYFEKKRREMRYSPAQMCVPSSINYTRQLI